MQKAINVFLRVIKWPVALLMVLMVLPAFRADAYLIKVALNKMTLIHFFLPMMIVIFAWFFVPGLRNSFFSVFEHELTHMIFALLSFNKPDKIEFKPDGGGAFSYFGRSNWLISLAPYFFPTFPFIVMLGGLFYLYMKEPIPALYWNVFGVLTGYHVASNLGQIHAKQTDFLKAGPFFTCLFLPGINLIVFGFLFSYACSGYSGIPEYWSYLMHETVRFVHLFTQNLLHL